MRQQQRDILKSSSDDKALAMKYRNELLKLLLPQRIEQKVEGGESWSIEIVDNSKKETDVSASSSAT